MVAPPKTPLPPLPILRSKPGQYTAMGNRKYVRPSQQQEKDNLAWLKRENKGQ